MSDYSSKILITPADFADTGQWRLIIYISRKGMQAFLKHISDKSRPMAQMLSLSWPETEGARLLSNIENAVYDHPGLLDDYATEIILETQQIAFAPNEIIDDEEDSESTIFSALFPGEDAEILSDRLSDITALFTLTRGLDSFISRTMAGSRIRSHLAVITERFRNRKSGEPRIYIDIREGEIDIIAFNDENLLSASVQNWRTPEDIAYRILNLLRAYGLQAANTTVYLSGISSAFQPLTEILSNFRITSANTLLPATLSEGSSLPLAVMLQAFR